MTGNALRRWRKGHGLSLRAAADLLGVSYASLSRYETGVYAVPLVVANAVAHADDVLMETASRPPLRRPGEALFVRWIEKDEAWIDAEMQKLYLEQPGAPRLDALESVIHDGVEGHLGDENPHRLRAFIRAALQTALRGGVLDQH